MLKIKSLKIILILFLISSSYYAKSFDMNLADKDTEVVKEAIDSGADLNAQDKEGFTALMLAVLCNQVDTVKLLIEAGADFNAKNRNGKSALKYAKEYGYIEVEELIEEYIRNRGIIEPKVDCYGDTDNNEYVSGISEDAPQGNVELDVEYAKICTLCSNSESPQYHTFKVPKFSSNNSTMKYAKKMLEQKNNTRLINTVFRLKKFASNGTLHRLTAYQRTGCLGLNKLCKIFKKIPK